MKVRLQEVLEFPKIYNMVKEVRCIFIINISKIKKF